ncbi:MAG: macA 2 [Acidobacteria bacterium]|nr:macA 2 [Acidobacteriota bacterium]
MRAMRLTSVLLVGAAIAVAACGGREKAAEAGRDPLDVQVEAASVRQVASPFETGGSVRARTTATLVSRIVAEVQEVLAAPGDRVRAGQVLIRLDGRDLQAGQARAQAAAAAAEQAVRAAATSRDGAEANLALATATHRRVSELRAKNSATPHEMDQAVNGLRGAQSQALGAQAGIAQAEAGVSAAQAALRAATVAASWATITAPFDGIVTEKLVEPGNMASPGVPLMTVEDTRGFRLEVRVDESRLGEIDRAKPVEVLLDIPAAPAGGAASASGTITEVSMATAPGSHAYLVKIDLPDDRRLRSGMFGRARFAGPAREALVVPERALVRHGQLASVFVVGADNRARLRMVNAGPPVGGQVEISAGLDAGERVVVEPPASLVDGSPVRAVSTRTEARS